MKPIISKNLTPLPPSLQGNGGFKASPLVGERFGEGFVYTLKTFKTSSYTNSINVSKVLQFIEHGCSLLFIINKNLSPI